jgi:hypothetical protein
MKKQHSSKVLLAILMLTIMVSSLALVACGKTVSPSDIATAELKAFQTEDVDELAKAVAAGDDITFPDEFLKQLQEFTYKIDGEKIDGNKAVVNVTISTFDLGAAYNTSIVQVVKDYYTAALAGTAGTEEELTQDIFNAFFEAAKSTSKDYTKTVDVTLDKTDGVWAFNDTENGDLIAAIWGGFMEAATEFAENAGDEAYINELIGK